MHPSNSRISLHFLFSTLVILVFLVPAELVGRYVGGFVNIITLAALLAFILIAIVKGRVNITGKLSKLLVFPVFLLLITFISLIVSAMKLQVSDAFELIKPIVMILALVTVSTLSWGEHEIRRYIYIPLILIVLLYVFLYFFELFGGSLGESVASLYRRDIPVLNMKVVGSLSQTYVAAMFFTFVYLFSLALSFSGKKPFISAVVSLLCLVLILGTQSRMGVIAAFIATNIMFITYILFGGSRRRSVSVLYFSFLAVFIISLPGIIYYAEQNYPYLYNGIVNYIFNFGDNLSGKNSMTTRLDQIQWALDNNSLIILGGGINKEEARLLESWYALYYYRYGMLGMLAYAIFWFSIMRLAFNNFLLYRFANCPATSSFNLTVVTIISVFPLFALSFPITDSPLIICFFYSIVAVVLSMANISLSSHQGKS